jgi:hypothetical protein
VKQRKREAKEMNQCDVINNLSYATKKNKRKKKRSMCPNQYQ